MPPSSSRRTRTRKQNEPTEHSEVDEVESVATPSRKRRRVNANETPKPDEPSKLESRVESASRRRKSARTNGDAKIPLDEPSYTQEEVDAVILSLGTAKYNVQARVDYANEVHEVQNPNGKEAYAKIAGNGWTFYVNDLEVRIGRPPDERQPEVHDGHGSVGPDHSLVHIDLGPSKHVSRQHAEIRYDENTGLWNISVIGRNGIKLDETPLARGVTAILHSGSVIDIAGTQMMFVTPNEVPSIHPTIMAQVRAQQNEDNDDDDEESGGGNYPAPATAAPPPPPEQRTPTRGSASRSAANHYSSSSRDFLPGQEQLQLQQQQQQARQRGLASSSNYLANNDTSSTDMTRMPSEAGKTSPSYARGLMLETTEDIDYSLDSAKDLKPPHSYAQLIGMAILSSDEEKLTLSKIYDWIKERYAFYRFSGGGWQNSIRHNLSLNKCFEKIARRTDEPGKGMKWQIVPTYRDEFIKKGLNQPKKTPGQGSSGPNSPTNTTHARASTDTERRLDNPFQRSGQHADGGGGGGASKPYAKHSPSSTPPLASYPHANQAYTPERAGKGYGQLRGGAASSPQNELAFGISPWPYGSSKKIGRLSGLTEAATAGTPGGPAMPNHGDTHDNLVTPLITRHAPKLAPPSAAHLPSQFMPLSSPAPFWKFANDFGSTPAKFNHGLDISPEKKLSLDAYGDEKTLIKEEKKSDLDLEMKMQRVQSSSPPPAEEIGQGSPTKGLGNRKEWLQPKQQRPQSRAEAEKPGSHQLMPSKFLVAPTTSAVPAAVPPSPEVPDDDNEEEGGMLDLARGFQPIGSFHRNMSTSIIRGT